jgi:predicted RNA methylase
LYGDEGGVEDLLARIAESARARDASIDRAARKERGVVHTPVEIARAIARAADGALRQHLGLARGLAADDVVIVDPAIGPGVFAAAALELAGRRQGAPRALVGIDVDPAAIASARAALEPAARAAGWPLRLIACDALDRLAPVRELERDDVVRVVLGNPPWAARTANAGARAAGALLDDFRRDEHGAPLREKKIGVLSDDYVRFLRWSCELVRRAERGGVIAMVTNGSYLDGPVHRGMRAAIAGWMDRIEIADLGGSALIARRAGTRDENVFGVRTSAAILIAVRRPGPVEARRATIGVRRVSGGRAEKIETTRRWAATLFDRATPPDADRVGSAPGAAWRADRRAPAAYDAFPSLAEWMPFHREGLQTNRDELVIDRDRDALIDKLARFARGELEVRTTDHFDVPRARGRARALLADRAALDRAIRTIAYRPLDTRHAIVDPALCHRARDELARAIDRSRLALVTTRKDRGHKPWLHFGAVSMLPDNCWLSTRSSCRARAFPLLDPEGEPNLARLAGFALGPEDFARWAIAWLASPVYQRACEPALQLDFPRIPAPRDRRELETIAPSGAALIEAFLGEPTSASGPGQASIGHHRPIAASALARAIADADVATAPLITERLGA